MRSQKTKLFLLFLIGAAVGMGLMYFFTQYTISKKENHAPYNTTKGAIQDQKIGLDQNTGSSIDDLTDEKTVIDFVKQNGKLPDYYITKAEARKRGWTASEGNLCDVLPGKAIGGDKFGNREKKLPLGNLYYEADVNYSCGRRNADRIVYTNAGKVWLTHDHYNSFIAQ